MPKQCGVLPAVRVIDKFVYSALSAALAIKCSTDFDKLQGFNIGNFDGEMYEIYQRKFMFG